MSYQSGIGPGMAVLGFEPFEPHIVCDGCGARRSVYKNDNPKGGFAHWFLEGKAAPGWSGGRYGSHPRLDYCHECTEKVRRNAL